VWLLFAGIHALGTAMTLMFTVRIGFWPSWFLDCPACAHPLLSLPYGLPVVGGLSLPAVLATGLAPVLLVRSGTRFGTLERTLTVALGFLALVHTVSSWIVRYPGSIPPVAVGTLLPFAAFVSAGAALVSREPVEDLVTGRPRGGWRSVLPLTLGIAGGLALGGVLSAAATVAGIWAAATLPAGARRYAVTGAVLGISGLTFRMTLVSRFWMFLDWFP